MEQPRHGHGNGKHSCRAEPIAKAIGADKVESPVDVNHIQLKADAAEKDENGVDLFGKYGKQAAEKQHHGDAQRNVDHALKKQREASAQSVLEVDADKGAHEEYQQDEP